MLGRAQRMAFATRQAPPCNNARRRSCPCTRSVHSARTRRRRNPRRRRSPAFVMPPAVLRAQAASPHGRRFHNVPRAGRCCATRAPERPPGRLQGALVPGRRGDAVRRVRRHDREGWPAISSRLDWVATRFSNGTNRIERIVTHASGELGYVIQAEHLRYRVPGETSDSTREYRVTMIFRREAGEWRIVHRQADSQLTRQ